MKKDDDVNNLYLLSIFPKQGELMPKHNEHRQLILVDNKFLDDFGFHKWKGLFGNSMRHDLGTEQDIYHLSLLMSLQRSDGVTRVKSFKIHVAQPRCTKGHCQTRCFFVYKFAKLCVFYSELPKRDWELAQIWTVSHKSVDLNKGSYDD